MTRCAPSQRARYLLKRPSCQCILRSLYAILQRLNFESPSRGIRCDIKFARYGERGIGWLHGECARIESFSSPQGCTRRARRARAECLPFGRIEGHLVVDSLNCCKREEARRSKKKKVGAWRVIGPTTLLVGLYTYSRTVIYSYIWWIW